MQWLRAERPCDGRDVLRRCHSDFDRPPLALIEADHAQRTARGMPEQYGDPDVDRIERAGLLQHEADSRAE